MTKTETAYLLCSCGIKHVYNYEPYGEHQNSDVLSCGCRPPYAKDITKEEYDMVEKTIFKVKDQLSHKYLAPCTLDQAKVKVNCVTGSDLDNFLSMVSRLNDTVWVDRTSGCVEINILSDCYYFNDMGELESIS